MIEVRVPMLPESIADATLVSWHKKPGEYIERDENLADLETDKVVLEVPAPAAGVLRDHLIAAGTSVKSAELLATIDLADSIQKTTARVEDEAPHSEAIAAQSTVAEATPAPLSPRQSTLADTSPARRGERRVPMSRIRARIAERLVKSQATQALLTTFNEVDMSVVIATRSRYKDAFERVHGARLGYMSFFVKASVRALKAYPVVNAYIDGADIVYRDFYDVGVAVATDRGLVVPVLRDADAMGLADIERSIASHACSAREGKTTFEQLTGGSFSITNGGVFGSLMSTPIVNAPQSAILGMHKVQDRPVVVDAAIAVRPMMYLALSYDHRIIDGREAVQFLVTVKDSLEDPVRLLLEV